MARKLTLLFPFILLSTVLTKGQSDYDADRIPAGLKEDAVAVVRTEEQAFDISSATKAHLTYRIAITILNKAGDRYAEMAEVYDRFSNISDIRGALYDASGKKIKDYKKTDIKDRSLISDFSMYEDNRLKYLTFSHTSYPYTVEYSYTKEFKGFLSIPSWRPVPTFGIAVEQSTYVVQCPTSYELKKMTSNGLRTDSATVGGKTQYRWTCSNVPAVVHEPYSVGLGDLVPWVSASPTDFEYDGTRGSVKNWNELGKWLYALADGESVLNGAIKSQVADLLKGATTNPEKIKILYDYLQQHTRYVSVQLGIGGFKPVNADKVAQVNYGDCKALSNFMKALLNEAGIASNLVVIGSGMPSLNAAYASFGQANHMILCIPGAGDTTFLECTSQHYPMGFVGGSNANRTALMVGADGGKLIATPRYGASDNYLKRTAEVNFDGDLVASVNITTSYGHAQFEDYLGVLLQEPIEQRKSIQENLGIPGMELVNYSYLQPDPSRPELTETIQVSSKQLLSRGGDRVFLTANLLNRRETVPAQVADRKTHFAVAFDYLDEDEIRYHLPDGYAAEYLPEDVELESEFGTYTAKYVVEAGDIVYRRTQVMNGKRYPPEKYNDFVTFCKKVYQSDKQKVVLVKSL
ncbi:DUF3857 domain-containing transglutaminase family protein [Parapedobacter sp. GCM10030251]|uniref:DUF3857 domain-containing transglutaminase family protein n=1 Tax=Parapedobacter sp. GCM10030251 TaxID=3273419 RepID=UPI00362003F4